MRVDYKLVTNVLGTAIFVALFALTMRRGATDPACGMKVDRQSAVTLTRDGATHYFCSEHCAGTFAASHAPEVEAANDEQPVDREWTLIQRWPRPDGAGC